MGLSYHFKFSAPETTPAVLLEDFLHRVEENAQEMGFEPTLVLNVPFDSKERQAFARRFTTGLRLEDEKLKGIVSLRDGQVWRYNGERGSCFVIPAEGVLLTVTNGEGDETVFGFLRYPAILKGLNGEALAVTGAGNQWTYQNSVDSPDSRYRQIVKRFTDAGYTGFENDEFE